MILKLIYCFLGSITSHVFESTGIYTVIIKAENLVGSLRETIYIRVQKKLLGINFIGPEIIPIGELVIFEVETRPPPDKALVKYYSWNVSGRANEQLTDIPRLALIYNMPNE